MDGSAPAHPGVRYPPPVLFLAGVGLAWLLHRIYPLPLVGDAAGGTAEALGWGAIMLAGLLAGWAIVSFRRARTAIIPNRPATMLVLGGPYRFTRNPMYVALTTLYLGVGVLLDTLWILALLPLVLWVLYATVIRREESYLAAAFGAAYAEYRTRVRRWI